MLIHMVEEVVEVVQVSANTNDNNIIGQLMIISWQSLYLDMVS